MEMVQANIRVPSEMLPWVAEDEYLSAVDRNAMLLYPLIKNKVLSHGKAAEILGIGKIELIDLYGKLGIPYLSYSMDEVDDEVSYFMHLKGV